MFNFHLTPSRILLLILVLAGCTAAYKMSDSAHPSAVHSTPKQRILNQEDYADYLRQGLVSYPQDVKPILDSRCVVCHACYDSPCQLKLSSFEGLDRGATEKPVYDTTRLGKQAPSRLFIDQVNTAGWRKKGFFPVLNEGDDAAESQLNNSLFARMLKLKQAHPLPDTARLNDDFDLDQNRTLECPNLQEFPDYAQQHPLWGMPYAMPALSDHEQETLLDWLRTGAKVPKRPPLSVQAISEINKWEAFFNGASLKQRLVSRYIYEHLYLGHLHFDQHPDDEFYYLVRSRTPPGKPIQEIPSDRPYDDPGVKAFYYRLRPIVSSIVDKNHFVYELNDTKLQRYHELFFTGDYSVTELPPYTAEYGANPFKTFAVLPLSARYQFLLDDALFFFAAYIKGPVCRGQVAVNVIRDQFWISFIAPDHEFMQETADFLASHSHYLELPASGGDELWPLDWTEYNALEQTFLEKKEQYINREIDAQGGSSLELIWDGNGNNRNAALSVFRHFNSATVTQGFIGDTPLTGWVVDYPIFERIYYLLVAGFNVHGSNGHQIATRKYMDFLRVESENNFLRFMPPEHRKALHHSWYLGVHPEIFNLMGYSAAPIRNKTAITYQTHNPKKEFFQLVRNKLGVAAGPINNITGCNQLSCRQEAVNNDIDLKIRALAALRGRELKALPEVSFLRVFDKYSADEDQAYTLLRNKSLSSVAFMFAEQLRRTSAKDTLTVAPGFLGSYPNIFFHVEKQQLEDFINRLQHAQNATEIADFYRDFGIRRSDPDIWEHSDWFYRQYKKIDPLNAGLFDLNRYENL